jgi:plastocyanin
MHLAFVSATLAALATTASAANFQVQVGGASIAFTPDTVNAAPGDTVTFTFGPKNHSVTQSSFAAPCQPLAGGIDSLFQPVAANAAQVPSFSILVNATTPLWFYCRQTGYCRPYLILDCTELTHYFCVL